MLDYLYPIGSLVFFAVLVGFVVYVIKKDWREMATPKKEKKTVAEELPAFPSDKSLEATNDERLETIEGYLKQIARNTNEIRRNTMAIVVVFIIIPLMVEACKSM